MFSTGSKKSKKCLGLYICLDALYLSQALLDGEKVTVEKFVKIPIVKKDAPHIYEQTSTMNVNFFDSEDMWLGPLKTAFEKLECDTKDIVVTLSPAFSVLRHFVMPFIERRFWRQSVPFEAKKYIPFSLDNSVYDYFVYRFKSGSDNEPKLGVIFGLTDKKISESISIAVSKLQLNLVSVEISAVSAQRFFNILDADKAFGGAFYAHFDEDNAYFLLSNNSMPLLFRAVKFGSSQMTERRRLGLRGSIDFVNKQLGYEVYEKINLSGENNSFWNKIVEDDTRLKVQLWNPEKMINLKNPDWGAYVSLGAGARGSFPSLSDIDLRLNVKKDVINKTAVSFLWKIVFAVTAFFLIFFFYYQAKSYYIGTKISALKKNMETIPQLQKFSASEIEIYISELQKRYAVISSTLSKRDFLTPKLEAVVNSIPSRAWLKNISYYDAIKTSSSSSESHRFILDGHLDAENKDTEVTLANTFKDNFREEPEIAKTYSGKYSKINLIYESGNGSLGRDDYSSFKLICAKDAVN